MEKKEINFYTHLLSVFYSIIIFIVFFYIIMGVNKWVYNFGLSRIELGCVAGAASALVILLLIPSKKKKPSKSYFPQSVSIIALFALFFFFEFKNVLGFLFIISVLIAVLAINALLHSTKKMQNFSINFKRSIFQAGIIILFATTLITFKETFVWISAVMVVVLGSYFVFEVLVNS